MNLGKLGSNGRSVSLIWIIAAGLAIILGGLVLASFTPQIFPTEGSSQAQQVDQLFRFMLFVGGAIFLLVNGVLVYSIWRFRARPGDSSDGPPIQGNTTLEFTWTVIPAVIVLVLTLYSFQVWSSISAPQDNEQTVHGIGQRFAWSFNYEITAASLPEGVTVDQLPPDMKAALENDGSITFTSTQLHTWVNQPVHMLLSTQDVNHSFWIPGMRVKQDLLSGRQTDVRFTPILAGPYRIVCAELCGAGHGDMAGTVVDVEGGQELRGAWLIVHNDEQEFLREFYNPEAMRTLFPPEDPVERGRQVITNYICNTCHTLSSMPTFVGVLGPNLDGIGTRAGNREPGVSAADYIHQSIREPNHYIVPGFQQGIMPQFTEAQMSEEDLQSIIAFLLTQ